jgi:beta-RFAP synthase
VSDGLRVETPARLHLGMIDLRGDLGRKFGGLGAALEEPRVVLEAARAREVRASGPDAKRAEEFARRFLRHHALGDGASIRVERTIPSHVGLGSGTQLALAVARALAALYGLPTRAPALALAVGRAKRSAVGTWIFERGGFVLEGGHREDDPAVPPLLFHHPVAAAWRCVLVLPDVPRGLSGSAEAKAFRSLTPPSAQKLGRIARLVLVSALPALVESDLETFGRAITEIQRHVGDCFKEAQGGRFASPAVARVVHALERAGANGAGQSSWGPAAFALAGDEEEARRLARVAREAISRGDVRVTAFDNAGAREMVRR